MESKTKQRLIGMGVVIGLVVIALPFLQSERESSTETMLVNAPPFPEQVAQVATATSSLQSATTTSTPAQEKTVQQADETIAAVTGVASDVWSEEEKQQKQAEQVTLMKPVVAENKTAIKEVTPTTTLSKTPEKQLASITESLTKTLDKHKTTEKKPLEVTRSKLVTKKVKTPTIKPIHTTKLKSLNKPVNDNGLFNLKNSAWVIQVGSFKNKHQALRLVNQLRTGGYRAFIQQMMASDGTHVRVFIGPESKQLSARALATKLEGEMRIRGIVISYKPLAI